MVYCAHMIAKRRESIWFLNGAGKFGYTGGYKGKFTRSELNSNILGVCTFVTTNKKKNDTSPVLRRGMPSAFHVINNSFPFYLSVELKTFYEEKRPTHKWETISCQ